MKYDIIDKNYKMAMKKIERQSKIDTCIIAYICPECGKDLDYTVFGSDNLRLVHCSHCGFDYGMISNGKMSI